MTCTWPQRPAAAVAPPLPRVGLLVQDAVQGAAKQRPPKKTRPLRTGLPPRGV